MAKSKTLSEKLGKAFDAREIIGIPRDDLDDDDDNMVPPKNEEKPKRSPKKKVVFRWEAPLKPKQSVANMKFVRSMGVIAIVVGLLLVAMQEFLLIIAIASLVFVRYLVTNTPEETVVHEVSNHGISFAGTMYPWEEIKQFYFMNQEGTEMMLVDLTKDLPARLYFVINPNDKDKLQDVVNEYIPFLEEAPKDFMKDAYNTVIDRFTQATS